MRRTATPVFVGAFGQATFSKARFKALTPFFTVGDIAMECNGGQLHLDEVSATGCNLPFLMPFGVDWALPAS